MPNFVYIALDVRGAESRGALEVANLSEACQRLKDMGLFPTKVVERDDRSKTRSLRKPGPLAAGRFSIPGFGGRIKPKTLTPFTRQVATLVEAGMPLLRGLRLLHEQETHRAFKRVLAEVTESIEGGASFSEALSRHPRVFSGLYLNMVRAGEISGSLELVLKRLAGFMEKAERIKGKVFAAMYYPVAVMVVATAIMTGLMIFVVPRFQDTFVGLLGTARMPAFTQFILDLAELMKHRAPLVLAVLGALATALVLFIQTPMGRAAFDRLKWTMPLLGPVFSKAAIARFTRTLGTLLSSGVPVLQALTIVRDTAGNVVIRRAVTRVHESVKEGEAITEPLRASGVFPAVVVGMVDVGEQTGALPDMLLRIADTYDEEVDNAVAGMTSLLEPILIVFLAVVVGSIVVAMFLPIVVLINSGLENSQNAGE